MQESKLKIRELTWQLELLVSLHPDTVGLALQEQGMYMLADEPSEVAKAISGSFVSRGFSGLTDFLSDLRRELSRDSRSPVVHEVINSWASLISSFSPEELLSSVEDEYDSSCLLPGDEIFISTTSGVREGSVRLFDPLSLYDYGQSIDASNPERDMYSRRVLTQLTKSGPYRKFSFNEETLLKLEQLKEKVGNFTQVVDYVMDAVGVSVRYQRPIKITPMLLVGDPGIGKSYFTDQLARCLGLPLKRVAMDNLQTGSVLAGSSYLYLNSETGVVFKVLTEEGHISPLVILDEIDKAGDSFGYGDPLSPLHNLLEPNCAKSFTDASVNLTIDASHVIWIATANSTDTIPTTLRSRVQIFTVSSQSPWVRERIVKAISEEFSQEYPGVEFGQDLLSELSERTPREQHQMLLCAIGRAVRLGELKVTLKHLELAIPKMCLQSSKGRLGYRKPTE